MLCEIIWQRLSNRCSIEITGSQLEHKPRIPSMWIKAGEETLEFDFLDYL
jgi:hypothetical protein